MAALTQQIRFCESRDGVRIAYATSGAGAPLVKVSNWLSHLEFDWQSPVWAHLLRELSAGHTLIRYDERGCGLSDWHAHLSFDEWVSDLESVVEANNVPRFPLLGISQGASIAIAYAATPAIRRAVRHRSTRRHAPAGSLAGANGAATSCCTAATRAAASCGTRPRSMKRRK